MRNRNIEIGSQIFINKEDTPEQVRNWTRQLARSGMKIIRLFMVWDQLEPQAGRWDFSNYDACLDEAVKQNVKVVPTLMAVSPPGWMGVTPAMQSVADLDNPVIWTQCLNYVSIVVERYWRYPCIDSWILWNEPSREITKSPANLTLYQQYLEQVYQGDIAALNKIHYSQYKRFNEVGLLDMSGANALENKSYGEVIDWEAYLIHNMGEKLKGIKAAVRAIDSLHSVQVNPHGLAYNSTGGQSIWKQAEIMDFLGCSSHPAWHSTRFAPERLHQSVAYFADQMRSASKGEDGEFWVTELQGGTTIFTSPSYLCPSREDIRFWLWESIGSGARATVFWCFNTRKTGYEAGEWSLLNQLGEPSERLDTVSEVAGILAKHQKLFSGSQPKAPDVWLLYSENTMMLAAAEVVSVDVTNPRNKMMGSDALCGAYLMCQDLGLQVSFIDESRLIAGGLPMGAVLIAPGTTAMAESACAAIHEHVLRGGLFIADGCCAMKDPYGSLCVGNAIIMDEMFGCQVNDIQADFRQTTYDMGAVGQSLEGWFAKCLLSPTTAEAIGHYGSGAASVTSNWFGAGRAVRLGTTFFQRYMTKPIEGNRHFLDVLLQDRRTQEITLLNCTVSLRLKTLIAGEDRILILLNTSLAEQAVLYSHERWQLESLHEETVYVISPGQKLMIPLTDRQVLVFKATRCQQ